MRPDRRSPTTTLELLREAWVHVFSWFFTTGTISVTLDRRFWPTTLGYLAAFIVFSLDARANMYVVTIPHAILAINITSLWNPARRSAR